MGDTDRAEVGREPFFRGRDEEYEVFRNAATRLKNGRIGGGSMVFQGAPGAGKTALMQECMEAVRLHSAPNDPWAAVMIKPENLSSSVEVMLLIVEAVNAESGRLSERPSSGSAQKLKRVMEIGRKAYQDLSERGVGIGGISIGGKPNSDRGSRAYSQRVFQNAAGLLSNFHIVVFVDEAQNTPVGDAAQGVVDCLHNPLGNIPLATAFFGLSDTEDVLRKCGFSRFARGRVLNLGLLDHADAASAIRRMFQAYSFADPSQAAGNWVDCLTNLLQGWPQHLNSVSVAAASVICEHGFKLEEELLSLAVERGEKMKREYCYSRLKAGSGRSWVYKRLAEAARENDGVINLDEIERLTKSARARSGESVDEFKVNALHAGLLMPTEELPDHFRIPIPSFGDYLCALPAAPPEEC